METRQGSSRSGTGSARTIIALAIALGVALSVSAAGHEISTGHGATEKQGNHEQNEKHEKAIHVPASDALVRLLEGNLRYVASQARHPDQSEERRIAVAAGQKPFAVILTCADSRVAPELLFDQGLGSLFVIRVAGNIADDAAIGSVEYAVDHLGSTLVVVLGHEKCGAVQAALNGGHAPGRIGAIVDQIRPALDRVRTLRGDPLDNAVRANVGLVVDRLAYAEPILATRAREGSIQIVGARYDLDGGTVEILR